MDGDARTFLKLAGVFAIKKKYDENIKKRSFILKYKITCYSINLFKIMIKSLSFKTSSLYGECTINEKRILNFGITKLFKFIYLLKV